MHLDTGFSADACFYALLVLAGLVLAAVLVALLALCGPHLGDCLNGVPMSFEEALAPGRA